jgi:hypothetical protein
MKKSSMVLVLIIFMFFVGVSSSFAGKHGIFLDTSSGSGEAEWDSDITAWDIDTSSFSGGYVFDTNPSSDKVFNYRLNVGVGSHEIEDEFGVSMESTGLYVENIFGFAFVKKDSFRWWAGPLVRLGFYSGDVDGTNIDVTYAEFGLGVVTGLNIKAGNGLISPSLGVRFHGFAGEGEIPGFTEDFTANSTNLFFNLAYLF